MDKIVITKSPSADSRTAKGPVDAETLMTSTKMHQADVENALRFIGTNIIERGKTHDHTKVDNIDDFCAALNSGHIKDTDWYQMHITEERHHLKSNVPKDVNLMDVIEHVCDCTMAGLARSGEVYDIDLSAEVLQLALANTVELLKANTVVEEDTDDPMSEEIN